MPAAPSWSIYGPAVRVTDAEYDSRRAQIISEIDHGEVQLSLNTFQFRC